MASAFLGKYASITAVDLIQIEFPQFLTEARFNSLSFYSNNYGNCKYSICGGLIIKQDLTVAVATTANKGMRRT